MSNLSPPHIILVLDNLRSCYNVGSILRTADGFGIHQYIFLGTTPHPQLSGDTRLPHQAARQTRQISKTALGAEKQIQGEYLANTQAFLNNKKSRSLVCLEQTADSQPLDSYRPPKSLYLVIGNEVGGISQSLLRASAKHLFIPMSGGKESFNVAVALGIALYQLTRPLSS